MAPAKDRRLRQQQQRNGAAAPARSTPAAAVAAAAEKPLEKTLEDSIRPTKKLKKATPAAPASDVAPAAPAPAATSAFPRGGIPASAEGLSRVEWRDAFERAAAGPPPGADGHTLFTEPVPDEGANSAGKRKRPRQPSATAVVGSSDAAINKPDVSDDQLFSAKRIQPGVQVVGVVAEITDLDVIVSLPGQCTGHLSVTEISAQMTAAAERVAAGAAAEVEDLDLEADGGAATAATDDMPSLGDLFHVGRPVVCAVLAVEDLAAGSSAGQTANAAHRRRIDLSVRPAVLNSGLSKKKVVEGMLLSASVASVEDHGYLLDFGIEELAGFLHNKNASAFIDSVNGGKQLVVGQTIMCSVLEKKSGKRALQVTIDPDVIRTKTTTRISDDKSAVVEVEKKLKLGSVKRVRVVGFDYGDDMVALSMKSSVMSAAFLRRQDVLVGTVLKGTIRSVQPAGVTVALTDHIHGFVPRSHLAEITKSIDPVRRFKVGEAVKCRVLSAENGGRRIILTLKKPLVSSSLPIITSLEVAKAGMVTDGFIVCIRDYGCIVSFFNNVKALVPIGELAERFITDPTDHFTNGQVVRCVVITVNPEQKKLVVSFKRASDPEGLTFRDMSQIKVGQILAGRVLSLMPDNALVELEPSLVRGLLPKEHLSDHLAHTDKLFSTLKEGQYFAELLVLEVHEKKFRAIVSAKPLLIHHAKAATRKAQLELGDILPGYVRHATESRAFLAFPGGLSAAAKLKNISELKSTKMSECAQTGQTVLGTVIEVDSESGKVEMSLKPSAGSNYAVDGIPAEVIALRAFFSELDLIHGLTTDEDPGNAAWSTTFSLGSVVKATVQKKVPFGLILGVTGGGGQEASGLITETAGSSLSLNHDVGTVVECRIIDADVSRRILDLRPSASDQKKSVQPAIAAGNAVPAIIEAVKASYLVVSLPQFGGALVYTPANPLNASTLASPELPKVYKSGQSIQVVVYVAARDRKKNSPVAPGYLAQRNIGVVVRGPKAVTKVRQDGLDGKIRPAGEAANGSNDSPETHLNGKSVEELRTVINAFDPSITHMADVTPGRPVRAQVKRILGATMNVVLADNLNGRVHITEAPVSSDGRAFVGAEVGNVLDFKVVGIHMRSSGTLLPISQGHLVPTAKQAVVDLTMRPEDLALPPGQLAGTPEARHPTMITIQVGKVYDGFVGNVTENEVFVVLGPDLMGRVAVFESELLDASVANNLKAAFRKGSRVRAMVLRKDPVNFRVDLSIRAAQAADRTAATAVGGNSASGTVAAVVGGPAAGDGQALPPLHFPLKWLRLRPGHQLVGRVVDSDAAEGLVVRLAPGIDCRVRLADISDEFPEKPLEVYRQSTFVACTVLQVARDSQQPRQNGLRLTLRASRQGQLALGNPSPGLPAVDDVRVGYVRRIDAKRGVIVDLGDKVTGTALVANLSDDFIKDWQGLYKVGDRVKARVLSVNETLRRAMLSLKRTAVDPSYKHVDDLTASLMRLKPGKTVSGQVSDQLITELDAHFSIGDRVVAKVLEVNMTKRTVSLTLKASAFNSDELADMNKSNHLGDIDPATLHSAHRANGSIFVLDPMAVDGDDVVEATSEPMEEDDDDVIESDEEDFLDDDSLAEDEGSDDEALRAEIGAAAGKKGSAALQQLAPLELSGFRWDDEPDRPRDKKGGSDEDSDDDLDDEAEDGEDGATGRAATQRSRRAKRRERREAEERVAREEQELASRRAPESADDFERLLLGSPNSSFLWIKFMAFHLQLAEVARARQVAERALKSISFREPAELLNVWVALLNLENAYGDRDSLLKTFERATLYNDAKAVFLQMALIYERAEKFEELDELFRVMTRRFKESCKVWVANGLSLLRRNKSDDSRKVLQRSLQSLPKRKHVKVVLKFAQLEFKHGDPERGRTLFEGIITNNPKRLDVWSVYIDMETRAGDFDRTRRLYERAIRLRQSSKKMKFLFKKYLAFEKRHGTEDGVRHVKEEAVAFVERTAAAG
ncbi:Protein RRP5, partial [Cladochytrium tenue]